MSKRNCHGLRSTPSIEREICGIQISISVTVLISVMQYQHNKCVAKAGQQVVNSACVKLKYQSRWQHSF